MSVWMIERWQGWRLSKPTWLEEAWVSIIPAEMVPAKELYGVLFEEEEEGDSDDEVLSSLSSSPKNSDNNIDLEARLQLGEQLKKDRILQRLKCNEEIRKSANGEEDFGNVKEEVEVEQEDLELGVKESEEGKGGDGAEESESGGKGKKGGKSPIKQARKKKDWDSSFWE